MKRIVTWSRNRGWDSWVYAMAFQHILWGVSLFVSSIPLHTTGIDTLLNIMPQYTAATVFIVCALLSVLGMERPPSYRYFLCTLPQLAILLLAAGSALNIIWQGHYVSLGIGDIPRWFLIDDQFHLVAILPVYMLSLAHHFRLVGDNT